MIAETFIKRPVTAIVISIVIVLVGIIAMATLPVAQYSDITASLTEQNLQVAAGTVGANPQPQTQSFEYSVLTNSRINTKEQFDGVWQTRLCHTYAVLHIKRSNVYISSYIKCGGNRALPAGCAVTGDIGHSR